MTFSIIARCHKTGQFGGAISSSSPAVTARCIQAKAGVGVATSQNITDPHLASILLDMTKYDLAPEESISELIKNTDFIEYRQLSVINSDEKPAVFSGKYTLGVHSECVGEHAVGAGNLLKNKDGVIKAYDDDVDVSLYENMDELTEISEEKALSEAIKSNVVDLPPLTKRQFNLYIYDNGFTDAINELLSNDERAKIEFDSVSEIYRNNETVKAMSQAMNWTEDEVDAMWQEALKL